MNLEAGSMAIFYHMGQVREKSEIGERKIKQNLTEKQR